MNRLIVVMLALVTFCPAQVITGVLHRKVASGGGASKAIIVHKSASCGSSTCVATTVAADTTGANAFSICAVSETVGPTLFGDSVGNTYSAKTLRTIGAANLQCAIACNSTSSATHTFHATGNFAAIFAYAVSNGSVACYDTETGGTGSGVTTLQPGSLAPTGAGEMFVNAIGSDNNNTALSIDSSFTQTDTVNNNGAATEQGSQAWLLNAGSGAQNPTWTITPIGNYAVEQFAIK